VVPTLEDFVKNLKENKFKNVIVMTGAGISVSCGIPDFRSPGTGLYANLQKYDLPRPEAIFDIGYFRKNPKPFCILAKELYPGLYAPSPAHYFIKFLADQGILLRNYSQNIDGLELIAGLPSELLVQAHGGFQSAHCIACNKEFNPDVVKEAVLKEDIPRCTKCNGLVKPDIVFFGENLPAQFHTLVPVDFKKCDCLIVMGTSLMVHPFAGLIDRVRPDVPRVLINLEPAGQSEEDDDDGISPEMLIQLQQRGLSGDPSNLVFLRKLLEQLRGTNKSGFRYGKTDNKRDIFLQSTTDDGVRKIATLAGWSENFEKTVTNGLKTLKLESKTPSNTSSTTSTSTTPTKQNEPSMFEKIRDSVLGSSSSKKKSEDDDET